MMSNGWNAKDLRSGAETIVKWMRKDIECMRSGKANVALALCILVYAESLGRLIKATLGNPARGLDLCAFTYFLEKMGYNTVDSEIIYRKLRNNMAHSYVPKKETNFSMDEGIRGIDTSNPKNIKVHLETLVKEFGKGTKTILEELKNDEAATAVINQLQSAPIFDPKKTFQDNLGILSGEGTKF